MSLNYYTLTEVANILKVSKRTCYNYLKAGQLPATKMGRDWRVSEEDLEEFLRRGTEDNYLDKIGASRRKA